MHNYIAVRKMYKPIVDMLERFKAKYEQFNRQIDMSVHLINMERKHQLIEDEARPSIEHTIADAVQLFSADLEELQYVVLQLERILNEHPLAYNELIRFGIDESFHDQFLRTIKRAYKAISDADQAEN